MTGEEATVAMIDALNLAGVPYMAVVHDVITVQANQIDWDYVYHWCNVHGTRELLDEIRASIPPI